MITTVRIHSPSLLGSRLTFGVSGARLHASTARPARHAIARTTPPSTRSAAPVVADAGTLQTYVIIAATSSGVANRCSTEEGRAVAKNSRSTVAASKPRAAAIWVTNSPTPSEEVGPGSTLY
jgi:hypothetical protein